MTTIWDLLILNVFLAISTQGLPISTTESQNVPQKSIEELVKEQTETIKKIVAEQKLNIPGHFIVANQRPIKNIELTNKDKQVEKEEKERLSIEQLKQRCKTVLKWPNEQHPNHKSDQIENRMALETTSIRPTVQPFGPQIKPEFLKRKPVKKNADTEKPIESLKSNYFVFTDNTQNEETNTMASESSTVDIYSAQSSILEPYYVPHTPNTDYQPDVEPHHGLVYGNGPSYKQPYNPGYSIGQPNNFGYGFNYGFGQDEYYKNGFGQDSRYEQNNQYGQDDQFKYNTFESPQHTTEQTFENSDSEKLFPQNNGFKRGAYSEFDSDKSSNKVLKYAPMILQKTVFSNGQSMYYWYSPMQQQLYPQATQESSDTYVEPNIVTTTPTTVTTAKKQEENNNPTENNEPMKVTPYRIRYEVFFDVNDAPTSVKPETTKPNTQEIIDKHTLQFDDNKNNPQISDISTQKPLSTITEKRSVFTTEKPTEKPEATHEYEDTTEKPDINMEESKQPVYTSKPFNEDFHEQPMKFKSELKFILPMTYSSLIETVPNYGWNNIDPYAYYPQHLRPSFMSVQVPYVPTYHMIRTLAVPNEDQEEMYQKEVEVQ